MREIKCQNCGVVFFADSNAQKHCSEKCRREYALKNKPVELLELKCAYCGKAFTALRKRKYCFKECQNKANGHCAEKDRKAGTRKMPALSLGQINKLARECGMSYGQYVAKFNC